MGYVWKQLIDVVWTDGDEMTPWCSCTVAAGRTPPEPARAHTVLLRRLDCGGGTPARCHEEAANAPHARLRSAEVHTKFQAAKELQALQDGSRLAV